MGTNSSNLKVERFHAGRLVPSITTAFVIALLEIVLAVSFAALIFSGDLNAFVADGIGLALVGAAICGLFVALLSSLPGTVSGNQDVPAAIMATAAAGIVGGMPADASSDEIFATIITAIILTTLLTGAFFWALGRFKLGALVRFLPYPVIGGFLAGTGWLLISGAMSMMTGGTLAFDQLAPLFSPEVLIRWLPGLVLAIVLFIVLKRTGNYLYWIGILLLAIVAFFLIARLAGVSVSELEASGWLLGPFPGGVRWQPIVPTIALDAYWPAIWDQAANLVAILIVSSVALLLNASGLELQSQKELRFNRELQAAGVGNLFVGLFAGLIGYQQLGISALNFQLKTDTRLTGLFAAALCIVALFFGSSYLGFFPNLVLGAMLLMLGLFFVDEWLISTWNKISRAEYAIIILIFLITAFVGFLEAVAVGILTAVILFVVSYSRVNQIRHELDGSFYRSRVRRPRPHRIHLEQVGNRLYILELQGFIFFGTADILLNQIRVRIGESGLPSTEFVILDFQRVTGLDSTALRSFDRLKLLAQEDSFKIIITGTTPIVKQQLEDGNFGHDGHTVLIFPHLDQGVEWCEDAMLFDSGIMQLEQMPSLLEQLQSIQPEEQPLDQLLQYLKREEFQAGSNLITRGEQSDSLFFIEQGQVTAQIESNEGRVVRLETMGAGSVVGELGLYLNKERTADIVADSSTVVYRLTATQLKKMEVDDPEIASALHRIIIHLLAERVVHLITTVNALEK
jgi:SulP family sulfate permease